MQWVRIVSPSFILLAPIFAMVSTAFEDVSTNLSAFPETFSMASSKELQSEAPFTAACTPFHKETAVGLDATSVSTALSRSARKPSRLFPS